MLKERIGKQLRCFLFLVLGLSLTGPGTVRADEAIERELLHKPAVFVLQARQPMAWADHPMVKRVWKAVSQSQPLQAGLSTPEFDRVLAARDFFETAVDQNWQRAFEDLTAGGIWIAVTPKPQERVTLIVTAKKAELWKRLQSAIARTRKSQNRDLPASEKYRGTTCYRLDKSHLAVAGRRLLLASRKSDLKRMIDDLLNASGPQKNPPAQSNNGKPHVKFSANMAAIRRAPDLQNALRRPADDAGQLAILGGWLDLLKSANRLNLELSWPAGSSEIRARLTAEGADPGDALSGFFNGSADKKLAPLLQPPGTIYTASWFRDYRTLWDQRTDLLTESALTKLKKGDDNLEEVASLIGIRFTPSKLFQQFGTQFRLVLARSGKSGYGVELENRLPAAAICISLPDRDAFQDQAAPFFRLMGIFAASEEVKMLSKTSEHAGAKLTELWFRGDEKAAGQGNRLRFNFNPTGTVARRHFILGSTRKIVTRVIDEIDRQKAETATPLKSPFRLPGATERQMLSFRELAGGLTDFREAILQDSVLKRGLTMPEAITEWQLAQEAIQSVGQLTAEAGFTENGFEYQVWLQTEPAE